MEMGLTLLDTTGATTARPPTLEVTETAGVRIPSAMVSAVANRVCDTGFTSISMGGFDEVQNRTTLPSLEGAIGTS
jgi:hypothetical protein